jgi:hypothetical protein
MTNMENATSVNFNNSIIDNHEYGNVGDFIRKKIRENSKLSGVSAFFTIYAYDALRHELEKIDSLRFLYGDPKFTQTLDPAKASKKAFKLEDEDIELENVLGQNNTQQQRNSL